MFLVPPSEIHPAHQTQGSVEREIDRALEGPSERMGSDYSALHPDA